MQAKQGKKCPGSGTKHPLADTSSSTVELHQFTSAQRPAPRAEKISNLYFLGFEKVEIRIQTQIRKVLVA
jgi:hypothetical protein